ncbi:MAG: gamma-glutamyltransferase [Polyangiales bacterium]
MATSLRSPRRSTAFGAQYTTNGMPHERRDGRFLRPKLSKANAFGLVGGSAKSARTEQAGLHHESDDRVRRRSSVLCIGASGGNRIVTATEQVALSVLVRGVSLPEAVAAPRVHHQAIPDRARFEEFAPLDPSLRSALEAKGHSFEPISNVANVQAIFIDKNGSRVAVSDPRKGGAPAGD